MLLRFRVLGIGGDLVKREGITCVCGFDTRYCKGDKVGFGDGLK